MFKGRKIITLLVSLLAAALLWLYVITTIAPEINVRISNIPVSVDGSVVLEERGLLVTDVATDSISLELNTSRANLSKLSASNIRISADVSKIREAGDYDLSYTVTFPDTVKSNDVDILRKSSNTIRVTVTKSITKAVPIELNWTGSVKDGLLFESKEIQLDPVEVVVEGPDYEVAPVAAAVVYFDVSDLEQTETVMLPVKLLDNAKNTLAFSEFTTVSVSEVSATLPVVSTKELTLTVRLNPGGGVMEDNAEVSIDPPTIRVKGASEVLNELPDELELGEVDLSEIADEAEFPFSITLQKGVSNMSGETEAVVKVRIKDVQTDTVSVSDIRLINAPQDLQTEITNRVVTITVRGTRMELNAMKQDKSNGIYVIVDAEGYTGTGQFGLTGKVVNEKYPAIGIVGAPEVNIVISERAAPNAAENNPEG